ncbi:uncharacterized protein TrAFT101_001653 [Trichoderma asperellum]|uniref:Uncharacterized protein n=1 Tax=Trichoderma asperellum (strain ATCC 204424 / CBS 433.97 / NBRC 101777) TaxID=1042311 RepID=A0A2T3ZE67_TRIA4|nr:hypothetical protein M441DRAFT_365697 [Trichoderma asperellum CBS 433.97]PTB43095.1 hypothetical protein M441DRAFT_365697 [Trichoderma asperellum CBS 433.97]UKZ85808.1 hypothetical protein TrAFT101_001653 [Trichoderma asperellum]
MSRAGGVPNAWDDDDWETQADRSENKETQAAPQPNLSRQERLQQHAEANRKLWESADSKETFHYVEAAGGGVPLTTAFKPQVKVLSRKPVIAKKDPITGLSQLSLDDDDASRAPEVQMTPDEIRAKQKRDREEKQRRYDEARAKIFGESAPSSRGSSPGTGTVTPPRTEGRGSYRGRGRGRGGGYNNNSNNNNNSGYNYSNSNVSSESSGQQFEPRRPANQPGPRRELFDPSSSPRPDSLRRGGREGSSSDSSMRGQAGRDEHQAIRSPRGPDGSGRGGFGFAQRGNRAT